MKYLIIIFFFLLISCGTYKKVYMCGDHTCSDKKEFKEYFAKNLIIEIQPKNSKKEDSIDLAKLNTAGKTINPSSDLTLERYDQINKDEENEKIDLKKKILNLKTKIVNKETNSQVVVKPKKKPDLKKKILNEETRSKSIVTPKKILNTNLKKNDIKKPKKNEVFKSTKSKNQISICNKLEDCDIDKITDLLTERGKKKKFPDITSE